MPGTANSPESMEEYGKLIAKYLQEHSRAKRTKVVKPSAIGLTITELVAEFMAYAREHYSGTANTASNEFDNCRFAYRPLVAMYGDMLVEHFTTDELREVRQAMITGTWDWTKTSAKRAPRPWSRPHANGAINRIKRIFHWAEEHNRCSPAVAGPIRVMSGIQKGRTIAKERPPVAAVADADVDATLPYLNEIVRDMVKIQRLTGLRPDNVTTMRPADIDRSGDIWVYRPTAHKGSAADRDLAVAIGPQAQAALARYLLRPAESYCFSPREAPRSSCRHKDRYTTASYRRAVRYGIRAAKIAKERGREGS